MDTNTKGQHFALVATGANLSLKKSMSITADLWASAGFKHNLVSPHVIDVERSRTITEQQCYEINTTLLSRPQTMSGNIARHW